MHEPNAYLDRIQPLNHELLMESLDFNKHVNVLKVNSN